MPGGVVEALAEDVLEIEAEEEVPGVRDIVERAVTPDEAPVVPVGDADMVIEDVVAADAEAEELPVIAELGEPETDEVPELPADMLTPTVMLEENETLAAVLAPRLLTELNLPGSRFR